MFAGKCFKMSELGKKQQLVAATTSLFDLEISICSQIFYFPLYPFVHHTYISSCVSPSSLVDSKQAVLYIKAVSYTCPAVLYSACLLLLCQGTWIPVCHILLTIWTVISTYAPKLQKDIETQGNLC